MLGQWCLRTPQSALISGGGSFEGPWKLVMLRVINVRPRKRRQHHQPSAVILAGAWLGVPLRERCLDEKHPSTRCVVSRLFFSERSQWMSRKSGTQKSSEKRLRLMNSINILSTVLKLNNMLQFDCYEVMIILIVCCSEVLVFSIFHPPPLF